MTNAIRLGAALLMSQVLWAPAALADDNFRCGDQLVMVGDTAASLLERCGEPTAREPDHWIYARGADQYTVVVYISPDGTVGQIEQKDPDL
jgi:Protein of unknown function (DUF2845)